MIEAIALFEVVISIVPSVVFRVCRQCFYNFYYRYVRQGDVMRLEEERRRELQHALDESRRQQLEASRRKEISSGENGASSAEAPGGGSEQAKASGINALAASLSKLNAKEVKSRLRNLNRPVTLFGETDDERVRRLVEVVSELHADEDDEYRLKGAYKADDGKKGTLGAGSSNVAGGRAGISSGGSRRREQVPGGDTRSNATVLAQQMDDLEEKHLDDADAEEDRLGRESCVDTGDHDGEGRGASTSSSFIKGNIATHYSTTPGLSSYTIVYKYFRNLLKQWEWDLDDREDSEKASSKGTGGGICALGTVGCMCCL